MKINHKNNQPQPSEDRIILLEGYWDLKENERRKKRILNKYLLLKDTPNEGKFQLPKVAPYTGEIPEVFRPHLIKFPNVRATYFRANFFHLGGSNLMVVTGKMEEISRKEVGPGVTSLPSGA